MQNLNRIRYVTQNYFNLQGMRWVFWGVLALAVAAEDGGWLNTAVLLFLFIPLFLFLFWVSGSYYERKYGQVNNSAGDPNALARMVVFVLTALTSFLVDRVFQPPVYLAPLVFAVGMGIMAWRERPFRWHYLVMALLVVGVDVFVTPELVRPGMFLWVVLGTSMIIVGLFDHWLLSRTFQPISAEDSD